MALPCNTLAQATVTIGTGDLYKSFVNPPGAAQPRVWWHWLDGNISRAGIRKDLMWMHRVGIGGLACIDAGIHTPLIVKNRVAYMSPEWKEAMHYATYLTDSLGMEFTMPAVAGWSESGAPWVSPKDAMKKLTWREITVKGGKTFKGKLPEPFNTTGMFQNISKLSDQYSIPTKEPYYHDITVIAYRLPDDDLTMLEMNPRVKASNGLFSLQQLTNGDYSDNAVLRPAAKGQDSWILFDFGKPRTIKSVSLTDDHQTVSSFESVDVPGTRFIEVSDNGVSFHRVAEIRPTKVPSVTSSIPATTARFFRVLYKASKADSTNVSEIQLYTTDRINHAEDKAGFGISTILASYKTPSTTDAVKASDVIDITSDVDAQGNISWKAPKGKWRIVRFGYSLAGSTNHPAVPEATGLEVDKLDSAAVRNYFTTYINMYKDATKGLMGKHGIQNILTDSYESGPENWTPLMRERFKEIAGYDMTPWLPVLTGQIVGSTEESERFLWDFRKVIGKLFVKYHYDQLTDIAKEYGMEGRYSESDEGGRTYLPDGMEVKRSAAFPM